MTQFQLQMGLEANGIIGKNTWGALIDAASTQSKDYIFEGTGNPGGSTQNTSWFDSTKPSIPINIPSGDNIIPKIVGSLTGTSSEAAASIQKGTNAFINENGFYQEYPSGSNVNVKPFETAKKIGTAATIITTAADIGNTWSTDNGNTNLQRLEKTGIQLIGTGTAVVVGGFTGTMAAAGVAGAPETGGVTLILVPAAAAIDYGASKAIDAGQDALYKLLNIK